MKWLRSFGLWSAALTILLFATPAHADDWYDCRNHEDPKVRVDACTAAIAAMDEGVAGIPMGYEFRAEAYLSMDQCQKAIEDYDRSISIKGWIPIFSTYVNREYCYEALGHFDSARADYRQVLKTQPDNAYAIEGLARLGQ